MSAVWALQGVVPHGKKEKLTPGVEIEENPVFGFWDCFMELIVNLPVSGIKPIVPGHLEVFFRYMQNEQLNEINGGKSLFYKRVVFMLIVMESHHLPIVGINPGTVSYTHLENEEEGIQAQTGKTGGNTKRKWKDPPAQYILL